MFLTMFSSESTEF